MSKILSIEGLDRSGKSTVFTKLKEEYDLPFKKYPDKESEYGSKVLQYLKGDLNLLKNNYSYLNSKDKNGIVKLLDKLSENSLVVVDRFDVSQYVYGKSLGVENPLEYLEYKSDYVIYIDISVEESLRRGKLRDDEDLLEEDSSILNKVKGYYTQYLTELETKGSKVYKVNGESSPEKVYKEVVKILNKINQ